MSAEDFQLIDDSKIDDSIIKQDYIKCYHQHGAEVHNENENIKLYFGENLNYIHLGNAYLEIDILLVKLTEMFSLILIISDWLKMGLLILFKKDVYLRLPELR